MSTHEYSKQSPAPEEGHTSVVYFHGIGNQRRFGETGRLIDSLERYCISSRNCANTDDAVFQVHGIRAEMPPGAVGEEPVSYVDTRMLRTDGQTSAEESYRFYEVYWAPQASEEVPTGCVLMWLLKCAFQTVKAWIGCKWRSRPVIRKMSLNTLIKRDGDSGGIDEQDAYLLEEAYTDFSRSEARAEYKSGSFRQFKAFLHKMKVADSSLLTQAARKWKKAYNRMQLWNTYNLLTLFLFLFLLVAAIVWSVILFFPGLSSSIIQSVEGSVGCIRFSFDLSTYNWINGAFIIAGILMLFYLRYFLRKYIGDIQFWGTYEETNTRYRIREQILRCGMEMLRHVAENKQCKRVVVIAHSLGTSIAFTSMQEYARMLELRYAGGTGASGVLSKFDHFVTLGSPIDKIAYFFVGDTGKYARVDELLEDIRGKITDPPFSSWAGQDIHWVNYYDVGDIISGSIESVLDFRIPEMSVDNVCVACTLGFPNPGACHTEYFSYRKVMKDIFDMVFDSKYTYRQKRIEKVPQLDYSAQARRQAKVDFRLFMMLPWLLLLMTMADLINVFPYERIYFRWIIGILTIALGLWVMGRFVTGRMRGHRDPIPGQGSAGCITLKRQIREFLHPLTGKP